MFGGLHDSSSKKDLKWYGFDFELSWIHVNPYYKY